MESSQPAHRHLIIASLPTIILLPLPDTEFMKGLDGVGLWGFYALRLTPGDFAFMKDGLH